MREGCFTGYSGKFCTRVFQTAVLGLHPVHGRSQGLAIQGDRELPFTRSGTLDYMAPEARTRESTLAA